MKKYLLILIISLGSFSLVKAQEDDAAKKIQALKTAFITQQLELTPAEAQKFWPVYGQYETEMKKILGNKPNPDVIENDEKILNVRKKYRPEFEKVLGKTRMNKFFISEKKFRGALMDKLKNKGAQQKSTQKKSNQQSKTKVKQQRPVRKP